MQLPCPGFLNNAPQIPTRRRHFTGAMLIKGQNQRRSRDLRSKPVLSKVPSMFRDAYHRPQLPGNPVQIAPKSLPSCCVVKRLLHDLG